MVRETRTKAGSDDGRDASRVGEGRGMKTVELGDGGSGFRLILVVNAELEVR